METWKLDVSNLFKLRSVVWACSFLTSPVTSFFFFFSKLNKNKNKNVKQLWNNDWNWCPWEQWESIITVKLAVHKTITMSWNILEISVELMETAESEDNYLWVCHCTATPLTLHTVSWSNVNTKIWIRAALNVKSHSNCKVCASFNLYFLTNRIYENIFTY